MPQKKHPQPAYSCIVLLCHHLKLILKDEVKRNDWQPSRRHDLCAAINTLIQALETLDNNKETANLIGGYTLMGKVNELISNPFALTEKNQFELSQKLQDLHEALNRKNSPVIQKMKEVLTVLCNDKCHPDQLCGPRPPQPHPANHL